MTGTNTMPMTLSKTSRTFFGSMAGFSLIELSIVLLIAGLLVAGAFQLTNSMQQGKSDQATANEMKTVVNALERFLVDQQGALSATSATPLYLALSTCTPGVAGGTNACPSVMLNAGLNLRIGSIGAYEFFRTNYLSGWSQAQLNNYQIGLINMGKVGGTAGSNGASNLRGLVLRQPTNKLNDARLSRIASLIGPQGGMISNTGFAVEVKGVFGSWGLNTTWFKGLTGANGTLAAYTTTVDAQMNTNQLSRIATGNNEANTMRSDLKMGDARVVNSVGYQLWKTNAVEGDVCDQRSVDIQLSNADDTAATPSQFKMSEIDSSTGKPNAERLKNAIVSGLDTSHAEIKLLHCQKEASGWFWRAAMPAQPTLNVYSYREERDISGWHPSRYIDGAYGNDVTAADHPNAKFNNFLKFKDNIEKAGSKPSDIGVVKITEGFRLPHMWFWNTGKTSIFVTLTASACGNEEPELYGWVRNYYSTSPSESFPAPRMVGYTIVHRGKAAQSLSFLVPVGALYAAAITKGQDQDGDINTCIEDWSETR